MSALSFYWHETRPFVFTSLLAACQAAAEPTATVAAAAIRAIARCPKRRASTAPACRLLVRNSISTSLVLSS